MNGSDAFVAVKFMVHTEGGPSASRIEPLDVAQLLNDFAASRGWSAITFYGTPGPAPLN
ncbi:hypothetical protein EDD90_0945 [Streptomyces sp. Ag109_O5-1]|uniref:hypothetical protein n=1 Tax=Streptomyces TaxID=1883 RepID=UPI000FA39F0F|nr:MULTISPECIES: hypothetical protein [Streptomyces]RPE38077.1 hypothetical protein EDD90_0945 [Streptomyces sp. Ag109_O5-1]